MKLLTRSSCSSHKHAQLLVWTSSLPYPELVALSNLQYVSVSTSCSWDEGTSPARRVHKSGHHCGQDHGQVPPVGATWCQNWNDLVCWDLGFGSILLKLSPVILDQMEYGTFHCLVSYSLSELDMHMVCLRFLLGAPVKLLSCRIVQCKFTTDSSPQQAFEPQLVSPSTV